MGIGLVYGIAYKMYIIKFIDTLCEMFLQILTEFLRHIANQIRDKQYGICAYIYKTKTHKKSFMIVTFFTGQVIYHYFSGIKNNNLF